MTSTKEVEASILELADGRGGGFRRRQEPNEKDLGVVAGIHASYEVVPQIIVWL